MEIGRQGGLRQWHTKLSAHHYAVKQHPLGMQRYYSTYLALPVLLLVCHYAYHRLCFRCRLQPRCPICSNSKKRNSAPQEKTFSANYSPKPLNKNRRTPSKMMIGNNNLPTKEETPSLGQKEAQNRILIYYQRKYNIKSYIFLFTLSYKKN